MEENKKNTLVDNLSSTVAAGMGFIVLCVIIYFCNFDGGLSDKQADWGNFGSYLGGVVGPVLSFISLIFFYYTFTKQIEQQEINQKNQQKVQIQTNITSFEASFFNLVMLFHTNELSTDIKLKIENSEKEAKGKLAFDLLYDKFKTEYMEKINLPDDTQCLEDSKDLYEDFYEEFGFVLGHYFRALYNIVVFIEGHENIDEKRYLNILMSNLSNAQIAMLLFNVLSKYGEEKFQPLVIKFNLLENLNTGNDTVLKGVFSSFNSLKMNK